MATIKTESKTSLDFNFLNNPKVVKWGGILLGEVVVVLLIFFVVIIPRFQETFVVWDSVKQQSDLVTSLQTKSEELDQFKVDYAPKRGLIDEAVPTGKDVGLILGSIRQLADGVGVAIIEYKLNPGVVKGQSVVAGVTGLTWLEVEMSVTGSESDMQKFLRGLDRSVPIKLVKNLEVSSRTIQGENGSTQIPEIKLLLWAYYLEDSTKAEATALLKQLNDTDLEILDELGSYERLKVVTGGSNAVSPSNDLFGLQELQ